MAVKVQREKVEQAHVVSLLRTIGATVYVLGTRRRRGDFPGTMQTPGIPDLLAFLPGQKFVPYARQPIVPPDRRASVLLFVEVKAAGGRLRPEQGAFRQLAREAEIAHVVGGLNDVIAWCVEHGYLSRDSVAHYRLPAAAKKETTV